MFTNYLFLKKTIETATLFNADILIDIKAGCNNKRTVKTQNK